MSKEQPSTIEVVQQKETPQATSTIKKTTKKKVAEKPSKVLSNDKPIQKRKKQASPNPSDKTENVNEAVPKKKRTTGVKLEVEQPTSASSSLSSSALTDSSYNLGDLSALFSPHLEKDVFSGALELPVLTSTPASASASTDAPLVKLGKNARKKLRRRGLPLVPPVPEAEKTAEQKAEEGILVNPEKIQQSLQKQRAFAKGENFHDDDERLPRTIFIGNVPVKMKIKSLINEFKQYGTVESARFRSFGQGDAKLSKRAAFATKTFHEDRDSCNVYMVFADENSAKSALSHNGKTVEGHVIRVDMAGGNKKGDKSRSIFVGNLPFTAKENDLRDFFSDSGPVENVRIVRDKMTGIGKGFAFVLFRDVASARKALAHDQSTFADRPLRVFKAVDKPKVLKKTVKKSDKNLTRKPQTGESWQGETAQASSKVSATKKRKHALRGKGSDKKPKAKPATSNSSKKHKKENDKRHLKQAAGSSR